MIWLVYSDRVLGNRMQTTNAHLLPARPNNRTVAIGLPPKQLAAGIALLLVEDLVMMMVLSRVEWIGLVRIELDRIGWEMLDRLWALSLFHIYL